MAVLRLRLENTSSKLHKILIINMISFWINFEFKN